MTQEYFSLLFQHLISHVGEQKVKSKSYLVVFLKSINSIYDIKCLTSGGYITSMVKLVITLRLLGGGIVHDLCVIFELSPIHCMKIFYDVLQHWILDSGIGDIYI